MARAHVDQATAEQCGELLATGMTHVAIAQRLGVSPWLVNEISTGRRGTHATPSPSALKEHGPDCGGTGCGNCVACRALELMAKSRRQNDKLEALSKRVQAQQQRLERAGARARNGRDQLAAIAQRIQQAKRDPAASQQPQLRIYQEAGSCQPTTDGSGCRCGRFSACTGSSARG